MREFVLINLSNNIKENVVEACIKNLFDYLESKGLDISNLIFSTDNKEILCKIDNFKSKERSLCKDINRIIEKCWLYQQHKVPLPRDIDNGLILIFNQYDINKTKFIITDDVAKTEYPWGEAATFCTVIKKLEEKNIWHEVAHLIGADDHYDENTNPKGKCNLDNCIMRYGKLDGELCEESINEINTWLKNNNC